MTRLIQIGALDLWGGRNTPRGRLAPNCLRRSLRGLDSRDTLARVPAPEAAHRYENALGKSNKAFSRIAKQKHEGQERKRVPARLQEGATRKKAGARRKVTPRRNSSARKKKADLNKTG
jgi:hypothetical protein